MATFWKTLQRWGIKAFPASTSKITADVAINAVRDQQWLNARRGFLWQRLQLWLSVGLVCLFTFTLRSIYDVYFPLKELDQVPQPLRTQALCINFAMFLILLVCFIVHKTRFGQRYPGMLLLGSSWSISLGTQFFATIQGYALRDPLSWSLLFVSQATFIPVGWHLHLTSQVGLLIYYFGVNQVLGLKTFLPEHPELYDVTFILYVFWLCAICDIGVYLYDRLQRSDFYAHQELELAYQKLQVAEAKYRSIVENAIEGIFQSSADGKYITANPALAKIYGYASPQEVTAKLTDIEHQLYVDPKRRAEFVRLIEKYGSLSEFESQIYRQDGSIVWISEKAYAVRDEQGKLLYYEGMTEDITKRKQAEEAVRVFFHAVSHDLRNPVLGTLMVLKNLLANPESKITISRSILERMVKSSDRQLNLINSLLEAHISAVQGVILQLQTVQLHTVVEAAIADLELMLGENQATLTNLVSADLPYINADPTQLWRVFSNLIANAIKHNPPGLILTINATVQGDKIYCTVSDNGVGISQQQSERLFDLYYRGTNTRNSVSLGLGLYLCKQIIQAHGGEIGVTSALSAGATFWFTLPVG
ncbi:PAS domain-containing sensor histidine kinase [Calothrix sp. FACHB-1219]|uniref:PAS domain-containing sensor histidine kinase n=1 Tax=unclassified Calothrix TaxID=2619626 RepID=UPI0016826A90|nr:MULTISPECIES: PAS domain-containing sensor histidine kinase [unclassified Calothrix]MBD2204108.1 PAS domain-containing sensor histidine kinase [Calothrix sp. FACHB-168]MBD2220922.1 PAS domain-containing sensor histidine kinase [Calothrix sp. FACHB-1219]